MFIGYAFHSVVYRFLVLRSDVLEPKKWHKKFDKVLLSYSYSYIDADIYIYTELENNNYVILSLYVDDIFIFGIKLEIIERTKKLLASNFDVKDLDKAKVILRIKIVKSYKG